MPAPAKRKKASVPARAPRSSGNGRAAKVCPECHLGKGKHAPGCSAGGCQFCHAQVGHRLDCPELDPIDEDAPAPKAIEILEGARYETDDGMIVVVQRATKGTAGIVRYRSEDSDVEFTDKASHFREIVVRRVGDDIADVGQKGPREVKTIVDGQPAEIVIDGTTGAPKQLQLIKQDPLEILERMRRTTAELDLQSLVLDDREAAHKAQKKLVESIQIDLNRIVREYCEATSGEKPPAIDESAATRLKAAAKEAAAADPDDADDDEVDRE